MAMHISKSGNKMILLGINASEYESECINCMYPQKNWKSQKGPTIVGQRSTKKLKFLFRAQHQYK